MTLALMPAIFPLWLFSAARARALSRRLLVAMAIFVGLWSIGWYWSLVRDVGISLSDSL